MSLKVPARSGWGTFLGLKISKNCWFVKSIVIHQNLIKIHETFNSYNVDTNEEGCIFYFLKKYLFIVWQACEVKTVDFQKINKVLAKIIWHERLLNEEYKEKKVL